MKANYVPTLVTALLLVPAAQAQSQPAGTATPPPAATASFKAGILNVRQAIVGSAEGKQAYAELQSQFAPRQNELENLRKQIEENQNRLRAGERTLSEEERTRVSRQVEVWSRQFQRKQEELREDAAAAEGEVIDRIGPRMREVLDRYARENGYSVVFDVSAQTTPVVYASSQVDITQDIVRLYDQAYPIKAPAQAPPAQPRPQPGQQRPAQQPPKPPQK